MSLAAPPSGGGGRAGRRRRRQQKQPESQPQAQAQAQPQGNVDLFGNPIAQSAPTPQPTQPTQPQPDLFGQQQPQQNMFAQQQANPFGNPAPVQAQQPVNPFGNPEPVQAQPQGNPFGAPLQTQTQQGDPFGSAPQQPPADNPFATWSATPQQPQPVPAPAPQQPSAPSAPADSSSSDSSSDSDSDSDSSSDDEENKAKANAFLERGKKKALSAKEKKRRSSIQNVMEPTVNVNVLELMKKGSPFLKFGSSGYPHFRQFQLTDDNQCLTWYSKMKNRRNTRIQIRDMTFIRFGQTTPKFEQYAAKELVKSSFSIIYNQGSARGKTLDLIAKDVNEFKIWTRGLDSLMNMSRQGGIPRNMKDLVIAVPIVAGRRSSIHIRDVKTNMSADELAGPILAQKMAEREKSGRARGTLATKRKVNKDLEKTVNKIFTLRNKLKRPKFRRSGQYDNMQEILQRCDESINRVQRWISDGQYKLCDDELWRTGIDLDSLTEMIAVL